MTMGNCTPINCYTQTVYPFVCGFRVSPTSYAFFDANVKFSGSRLLNNTVHPYTFLGYNYYVLTNQK